MSTKSLSGMTNVLLNGFWYRALVTKKVLVLVAKDLVDIPNFLLIFRRACEFSLSVVWMFTQDKGGQIQMQPVVEPV